MAQGQATLEINGELDLASAAIEGERAIAFLEAQRGQPIEVSLKGESATAPALQIFFATLKQAQRDGMTVSIGVGPDVATAHGRTILEGGEAR